MTSELPSPASAHRIRVRRLADARKLGLVPWSTYEVQAFTPAAGASEPILTTSPSRTIGEITGLRHPADLGGYSHAADMGWDGGVGLWRGDLSRSRPWPGEPWHPGPPVHSTPSNAAWVERRAARLVRDQADSLVGALLMLTGVLARGGQESWAARTDELARSRIGLSSPGREQWHSEIAQLWQEGSLTMLSLPDASFTERAAYRLLIARVLELTTPHQ